MMNADKLFLSLESSGTYTLAVFRAVAEPGIIWLVARPVAELF